LKRGILILTLLAFCSCNKEDHHIKKHLLNLKIPKYNRNLHLIELNDLYKEFNCILEYPIEAIDTLIKYKGNKNLSGFGTSKNLGFYDKRVSIFHKSVFSTDEVAALHLINAIYYKEYYFCSDRIIFNYVNDYPIFDTSFLRCYDKKGKITYSRISGFKSKSEVVEKAWENVIEWRKKLDRHTLEELRTARNRPFGNSKIYFVGEPDSPLNEYYPNHFCKNYKKVFLDKVD
jgi:hypothetical protein